MPDQRKTDNGWLKSSDLTLFRQELYFPDVEVGNHTATCDVIIFDVTRLF